MMITVKIRLSTEVVNLSRYVVPAMGFPHRPDYLFALDLTDRWGNPHSSHLAHLVVEPVSQ